MYKYCFANCIGLALIWTFGCTAPPPGLPPAASVKGTVNLDGKPLPAGELHISMLGVPPSVLKVSNGTFSGEASIGKNQVEVYIYSEGAASEKYGGARSKINTAPEKYWGPNTVLDATVEAGGANEFKFDLSSK